MSREVKFGGILRLSVFAISIMAFALACDSGEKDQEDSIQSQAGTEGVIDDTASVLEDPNTSAPQATAGESQTEDPNQQQAGEPVAGAGGGETADAGLPLDSEQTSADAGVTAITDAAVIPSGDAALSSEAGIVTSPPCTFDINTAITIPDGGAAALPDAGGLASAFQMPVVNGVCLSPGDPCEGGSLEEFELPTMDAGVTVEIDRSGGCETGLFCCIGSDQCAAADVAMQESLEEFLNGPSQFNPGMTVRESLASFGVADMAMNLSCAADTECTGLFSLNVGCSGENICCVTTSFDDLMSGFLP